MIQIDKAFRALIQRLRLQQLSGRLRALLDQDTSRLALQSIVIGAVVWLPIFLLRLAVEQTFQAVMRWVDGAGSALWVMLPLLVGASAVAALVLYRGVRIIYHDENGRVHSLADVEGDGLERAIALYYASEPSFERTLLGQEGLEARWELPTYSLALRKMAATWATLGSGGSGGLEGSVALVGECLATMMFKPRQPLQQLGQRHRWLRWPIGWWSINDVDQLQTAQLSGIAAAIATLTGAPFTSAFFAAEVMYRRRPLVEKLFYSLISTLVAYFLSTLPLGGHTAFFTLDRVYLPPADGRYYGLVVVTAVAIAMISIYFARLRKLVDNAFHHGVPNIWLRHLSGAFVTGVIALITLVVVSSRVGGTPSASFQLVLGSGQGVIGLALAGQLTLLAASVALIGKILTTIVTIGSGGSAGLLIPSLYLGTMSATIVAALTGYEPMLLIAPAMTASLASISNVPIAAILLPVELFSSHYLPPALLALVVCALLTQNNRIYRTQRETFDKRQILPGVEVRRVPVPKAWDGQTLIALDIRRRFGVTVLGVLEMRAGHRSPLVRLDIPPTLVLTDQYGMVVMGEQSNLDALEEFIRAEPPLGQVEEPPAQPGSGPDV